MSTRWTSRPGVTTSVGPGRRATGSPAALAKLQTVADRGDARPATRRRARPTARRCGPAAGATRCTSAAGLRGRHATPAAATAAMRDGAAADRAARARPGGASAARPSSDERERHAATATSRGRRQRVSRSLGPCAGHWAVTAGQPAARVDAEQRHHAAEGGAVVGRLLQRVAVGDVVVLAALVVRRDARRAGRRCSPRYGLSLNHVSGADELVLQRRQVTGIGFVVAVPLLDVGPVRVVSTVWPGPTSMTNFS